MADIATLGVKVTTDGVAQATQQLDGLSKAGTKAAQGAQAIAPAMDKATMSAKQLSAATRQLPMQFTDIFTGLASGQKPLQVLLQQGGQLKDTFGGVGPALRASAGYVAGLINPVTLLAGAGIALAAAWKQNEDRLNGFNIALARTHGQIGLTAEQLDDMARNIARSGEASIGGASEAVTRFVAGGRIAREQLEQVSRATVEWAAVSGDSIDDVAKRFEQLAKSPVEALLALNDAENFLTQAQVDRIIQLRQEGREQELTTFAVKAGADALEDSTRRARENLGEMRQLWLDVKDAASTVWGVIGDVGNELAGIARRQAEANASMIAQLAAAGRTRGLLGMASMAPVAGYNYLAGVPKVVRGGQFDNVRGGVTTQDESVNARAQIEAAKKEQEEWDRRLAAFKGSESRYWGDTTRKAAEKAEVTALLNKRLIDQAAATKRLSDIDADYAARAKKAGTRSGTDYAAPLLQSIRQQIALNTEQAQSEEGLSQSQRLRIRITETLVSLGAKVSASQRAEIEAQLEALRVSGEQVESMKEQAKLKEDMLRLDSQLAASAENRASQNQAELMAIGRGGEYVERARRRLDIEREYEDGLKTLRDKGVAETSESYRLQEEALRRHRDAMLETEAAFYAQKKAMELDASNGVLRALEDYATYANDVASRSAEAVGGIIGSMESALSDFFRTGKLDWKGFLDDVNAQLARFFAQQIVKQIVSSGQGADGGGGWFATLMGSIFGGSRGFASGGYTGNGPRGAVAGVVHGQEFVFDAGATARIGRDNLAALASGRAVAGNSMTQVVNFAFTGRMDRRSQGAVASAMYRETASAAGRR